MRIAIPLTVLATALACSLATAPAHARARVFVASYGNDANPCTFGSPCKTFQQAVNVVDAGGEVTAIDSAGFGPINITKAVTITSPDGVEAGIVPSPGGDAIDINAGANDVVVLRGLTLNGANTAYNGIVFNSGASLLVSNCVVQDFVTDGINLNTGNGILITLTAGTDLFTITDTTVANNLVGIAYLPRGTATVNGVISHVNATNNQARGIMIGGGTATGGSAAVTISDSVASNNRSIGISADINPGSTTVKLLIDNVTASGNGAGIEVTGTTNMNVLLGRSFITGNSVGIQNNTSNTFYTYQNNQIDLNDGDDINGAALNKTKVLQ